MLNQYFFGISWVFAASTPKSFFQIFQGTASIAAACAAVETTETAMNIDTV